MKMRVLLVAPRADEETSGGQAKAGRLLADSLIDSGEIEFRHVVQPNRLAPVSRIVHHKRRLTFWREFYLTLQTFKPEIVHFFSPCTFGGLAEKAMLAKMAKQRGAHTILNLRNDPRILLGQLPSPKRMIAYRAVSGFDGYFCQFRSLRAFYEQSIGAPPEAIYVVPNAIAGSFLSPDEATRDQRFVGRRVATIGTLEPRKGTDVLLRAIAAQPHTEGGPLRGDIIGGDFQSHFLDYAKSVRDLYRELGLSDRVVMHGEQLGDAKNAILDRAAIFALPSHSEGFPNVVLEALQRSLPVVMTDVGAAADIAEAFGKAVSLVPPSDHFMMAASIRRLLDDRSEYEAAVASIADGLTVFSPKRMAQASILAYSAELNRAG